MDVGRSIMRSCGHSFIPHVLSGDSTIVDFGVHKGEFAGDLIRDFSCRVFGAEPVPELYAQLPKHENFAALPVAVGERNGQVDINVFRSRCASVVRNGTENNFTTVSVECVTLEEFLSRYNISFVDLLKIDIEGAEIGLFRGTNDGIHDSRRV